MTLAYCTDGNVNANDDAISALIPKVKENEMKLRRSTADLQQFKSEIDNLGLKIRHKEQLIQGYCQRQLHTNFSIIMYIAIIFSNFNFIN